MVRPSIYRDLASLGVATVYEAAGAIGLVAEALIQIVPASRAAGPARIAVCGPGDNRAVHEVMGRTQPGDVLVLALERVEPVALLGELLATQAKAHGVAGVLVDGAVRDVDELRELGLPVWARYVHATAATKLHRGAIDVPVNVGGVAIAPGDAVVLDADGAVVVPAGRLERVADAGADRRSRELRMRESFLAGELSYDLFGMRAEDEAGPGTRER
ncbi:MAG: 4-carboxy-4-hydroxy-2-oxoadipate aldolase/oxaloacetate decarboxylase [Acidimicrobiales bacterium]